jgi:hypothetical protein
LKFTTECLYETSLFGPPPLALQHQSGGDDRTGTRPGYPWLQHLTANVPIWHGRCSQKSIYKARSAGLDDFHGLQRRQPARRFFGRYACDVNGLRSRACRFLGDGERSPSWQSFCGRNTRQHPFFGPACSVFLALYAMNFRGLFDPLYSRSEAILAQLKEVTSTSSRLFRASLTISFELPGDPVLNPVRAALTTYCRRYLPHYNDTGIQIGGEGCSPPLFATRTNRT